MKKIFVGSAPIILLRFPRGGRCADRIFESFAYRVIIPSTFLKFLFYFRIANTSLP